MNDPRSGGRIRALTFDGTRNFRDLGGIRTPAGTTRHGVVYRSDRLSNLTDADCLKLRDLGIAAVIDMRSDEEVARAPNRLPRDADVKQLSRPFLPRQVLPMFDALNSGEVDAQAAYAIMIDQYQTLVREHTADYARIIEDLLQPGSLPAIVHCTSGKDRTGMVAAILLLAVGAPLEAVTADYVLTQDRIEKVDYFEESADPEAIANVMAAKPDYILAAVETMEKEFDSVDAYLCEAVGIDDEKREVLRALLLVP